MQVKVLTFETGSCTVSGPLTKSLSQRKTSADELVFLLIL